MKGLYKMSESINLAEARKKLPELADRASAGQTYFVSRRGRELAVLIGVDEYQRLKELDERQRNKDFDLLLASPPTSDLTEDEARAMAVQLVREERSRYASRKK
jgi:prevent-host-death family protein